MSPRASFTSSVVAVLRFSPANISCATLAPVCKAFFPSALEPCFRCGVVQQKKPLIRNLIRILIVSEHHGKQVDFLPFASLD